MLETIVVGAGQAGLAASWHLARRGMEHVVLEREGIGDTWRTQRWDSFTLNTPAWMNRLPGIEADLGPRDGFPSGTAWVAHLEEYAGHFGLPVRTGIEVIALKRIPDGTFAVRTRGEDEPILARAVIVASGVQREPRIPGLAADLPREILQLHTAQYRSPGMLPPGAVLVVGAAQSGGQIVEDLLDAGRVVHLATSRVPRVRRRTLGRDTLEWLVPAGFMDLPTERVADPAERHAPQPLTSGVGRRGHTLSLQWLEARGARLLGRLRAVDGGRLRFDDDLGANIRFGDETSAQATRNIVEGLAAAGLDGGLPPLEDDPADVPHPDPDAVHGPTHLDLADAGISTVIWATGFRPSMAWLPAGLLDERGALRHAGGVTAVPGLCALGFPWLRTRGSGIVYGLGRDADAVVTRLTEHLARVT
ncbi:MAG: NAD(P)/FAD-dependent oxidoreductase [Chloroflexi bacterium]|jgi:putative flavoprotein involved in K+ transport|nr:NAD(P)/FAD-dependent oxidoreductase [Chloroflexota bacterium]